MSIPDELRKRVRLTDDEIVSTGCTHHLAVERLVANAQLDKAYPLIEAAAYKRVASDLAVILWRGKTAEEKLSSVRSYIADYLTQGRLP